MSIDLHKATIIQYPTTALDNQVETMSKIGSWTYSCESNTLKWSKNTFNLHGLSVREDLKFKEILSLYDEEQKRIFLKKLQNIDIDQMPFSVNINLKGSQTNLTTRALKCMVTPMVQEHRCVGAVGVYQDIDDVVMDQDLLKDSQRKFQAIFNQSFQFVGLLNAEGKVIEANETALQFGGFELELIEGKHFWNTPWFNHKSIVQKQLKEAIEAASKGRLIRYETELIGVGGNTLTVDLSIRPIIDDKGEVMYLIPEGRDISDKREVHQQLIELNRELEKKVEERTEELKEINQDLESFAYSISHDLRAPLRAINGFSQILSEEYETALDEEGLRLLGIIHDNSEKMSQLIDDLLLFSRTSRKEVNKTEIDINKIVKGVIDDLSNDSRYSGIKTEVEELPPIHADYTMLTQVMVNLIGNAFKYSSKIPEPLVIISSKKIDNYTEFCVEDNGVGFNNEHAKNLFQVFQRLNSSKGFEGTGVGLSIVRKIIEKHGGKVWATGELNKGAKFYFTVPNHE